MKEKVETIAPDTNSRLEIRSEAVQDILSFIPHWIIRSGITIVFVAVGLMLLATWLIQYPDIINARITITTETPPAPMVARSSGKIERLFVTEKNEVSSGDYLAAIESTARLSDVLALRVILDSLSVIIHKPELLLQQTFESRVELGDIQSAYLDFLQQVDEYQFMHTTDYHARRIASIESQIAQHYQLSQRLRNQQDLTAKELHLTEGKFARSHALFDKRLISELELGSAEEAFLQKKHAMESAETAIVNNTLQLTEYQKTLLDLRFKQQENERRLTHGMQQSFKRLQTVYADWEQRYILRAPIAGRISFFSYWSDNQFVNASEEVLTVVPVSGDILGKIELPGAGTGKVEVGQRVQIKFDSYPFREFGMVAGEVTGISLVMRENIESISVRLPEGLRSSYDKLIVFKQGMQGTAEIITEDLRLFERIFNQLRALLTQSDG